MVEELGKLDELHSLRSKKDDQLVKAFTASVILGHFEAIQRVVNGGLFLSYAMNDSPFVVIGPVPVRALYDFRKGVEKMVLSLFFISIVILFVKKWDLELLGSDGYETIQTKHGRPANFAEYYRRVSMKSCLPSLELCSFSSSKINGDLL